MVQKNLAQWRRKVVRYCSHDIRGLVRSTQGTHLEGLCFSELSMKEGKSHLLHPDSS